MRSKLSARKRHASMSPQKKTTVPAGGGTPRRFSAHRSNMGSELSLMMYVANGSRSLRNALE